MIIVHPQAAVEAQAARAWYAARNRAVGMRFLAEYDRAIDLIRENPGRWAPHPHVAGYRWFHLKRFPYAVIYEVFRKERMSSPWHTIGADQGNGVGDARIRAE